MSLRTKRSNLVLLKNRLDCHVARLRRTPRNDLEKKFSKIFICQRLKGHYLNSLDSGFHRGDDFLRDHQYLNLLVLIFPVPSPGNLIYRWRQGTTSRKPRGGRLLFQGTERGMGCLKLSMSSGPFGEPGGALYGFSGEDGLEADSKFVSHGHLEGEA